MWSNFSLGKYFICYYKKLCLVTWLFAVFDLLAQNKLVGADSKMVNNRLIQRNWLVPALLSNPVRMGEDRPLGWTHLLGSAKDRCFWGELAVIFRRIRTWGISMFLSFCSHLHLPFSNGSVLLMPAPLFVFHFKRFTALGGRRSLCITLWARRNVDTALRFIPFLFSYEVNTSAKKIMPSFYNILNYSYHAVH